MECDEEAYGAAVCEQHFGVMPFGFNSAWRSPMTGLSQMRHRWYSPGLNQFLSHDPLEHIDSYNLYAFAGHDPVNFRDPFGLEKGGLLDMARRFGSRVMDWFGSDTGQKVMAVGVGLVNIGMGTAEIFVGVGATMTGAGALAGVPIAAIGADTLITGLETLMTGQIQKTMVEEVATEAALAAGAEPETAETLGALADVASGVATLGTNKAATHLARRSAQRLAAKNAGKTAGKNALKTPKPTPKTAPNTGKVKPCPPNSFEASTLVLMCDGTQVAIEELEEGDWVWARDVLTGLGGCEQITQTFVHEDADLVALTLRSELSGEYERLVLTHDHPMLSPDGEEVEVYTLKLDQRLGGRYDDFVVVALEPLELVLPVYNLSVAHAHTFFVGDAAVWAHNCDDAIEAADALTPRAARRESMRRAGIPTSQQPVAQKSINVHNESGVAHVGRQYDYAVPGRYGTQRHMSVQHSLTDDVAGHGPHWEAGQVKTTGQLDSVGRPRLKNNKAKVDE